MKKRKVSIIGNPISPLFWHTFNGNRYHLLPNQRKIECYPIEVEDDPQTMLIVFGSYEPYAYDYCEYTKHRQQKRKEKQEIERIQAIQKREKEAIAFNESLKIPVEWSVQIKQNSKKSWGNGKRITSVEHIFLHKALRIGNQTRPAYSFLCGDSRSKTGGNCSGQLGTNDKTEKVNCKTCLRLARRFQK